jgi:hypothetical protein
MQGVLEEPPGLFLLSSRVVEGVERQGIGGKCEE